MSAETKSTCVDEPEIADLRCITAFRAGMPRPIIAMFNENLVEAYAEEQKREQEFREEVAKLLGGGMIYPMPLWRP